MDCIRCTASVARGCGRRRRDGKTHGSETHYGGWRATVLNGTAVACCFSLFITFWRIEMKTLIMGTAALLATTAFAQTNQSSSTQSTSSASSSRMATMDTSSSAFTRLDKNSDGRISSVEAANDSTLAGMFSQGDSNRDGYLSRA